MSILDSVSRVLSTRDRHVIAEGFLFDLFGTLLMYGDMAAAWDNWLAALHRSLTGQGLCISNDTLACACEGIMAWPEPPNVDDGLTVYERRLRVLGTGLGVDLGAPALRKAADSSISAWQAYVTLDPNTIPVLKALRQRGHTLGLVSNYDHPPHVRRLLDELGLVTYLDPIVVSGEVGMKKPDPGILRFAISQMGLTNDQVAYVGDSEEDLQASLRAGVMPVLIRRPTLGSQLPAMDYGKTGSVDTLPAATASSSLVISALTDLLTLVG